MERSESMFLCNHLVWDTKGSCKELDEMIDDAAERVRKHYKIEDIGDPGTSTDVRPLSFLSLLLESQFMV